MSNALLVPLLKTQMYLSFNSKFVDTIFSTTKIKSSDIIQNLKLEKPIGDIHTNFLNILSYIEQYNGFIKGTSESLENLQKVVAFIEPFLPLCNNSFEPLVNLTKEFLKDQFHSNKEAVVTSIKERFIVDTETAISLFPDLIDKLTIGTIEILQIGTIIDFVKKQYNDQWIDCLVEIV